MPAFEYHALDSQGRTRKGVQEGDTPRQVRAQLRDKGLTPLQVEEISRRTPQARSRLGRLRISAANLALMTRQLATLVQSGLALEEALQAVASQTEQARLKSMLMAVRSRVLEGHSLAEGLAEFPHVFPDLYRATVSAGEQSGHLDVVLERLADYTETRQQIRQKTLLALFYPLLLSGVALLVVIALLTFVVPQVVQVFAGLKQELPWLTRTLIQISSFLQNYGLWLLSAVMGLGFLGRYLLRFESILFQFHRMMLRLPILGRLEQGLNAARFTRTLSILSASGVPLLDGLRISAQVIANRPMRAAVQDTTDRVREGTSLHTALENSGLFPPMTIHLIASGEASGHLENMLERAAQNQEREIETIISVILGLFEPLLILVMGGVVLTIVLAILMPIFELNQLVK